MSVIQTSIFTVFERFPDRKDNIKRLFRQSKTFQTMCEDYRKCAGALQHWKRSSSPEAPQRREEYRRLLEELETEILKYMEDST